MKPLNFKNSQFGYQSFNVKRLFTIFIVLSLVSYGLFNARNIIIGPKIEIFTPSNLSETKSNTIEIKGVAKNATYISLNERPISVDTSGLFDEKLLLSPGSNLIEIKARDRFKKETSQTIQIYYINNKDSII